MMQQLGQLYNIHNTEQLTPAHIAQMGAQTRGLNASATNQEFENQWAQPNAEAMYGLHTAQAGALNATANQKESISPHDIPFLVQLGIMTPEEAQQIVLPPEMKAARVATAAQKEKERQQMIQNELQMQGQPTPAKPDIFDRAASIGGGIGGAVAGGARTLQKKIPPFNYNYGQF